MIPAVAIPALIALVCKLGLLGYSMRIAARTLSMRLILALLLVFVLHNSVEFVGLIHFNGEVTPAITRLGFAYLSFLIPAVALILHLSLRLSFDRAPDGLWSRLQPILYVPGFVLVYLLLATDQLVTGFQTFRSAVLRIPGPWYILFESYVISYLLVALASLVYGARASRKSAKGRSRNRLWLLALLPTGLLILYLIVANHLGAAKITSTIYVPIPMTFFLLVATYATYRNRLPDVGFFIPGSKVRKRKAALYERARTMIDIGEVRSAKDIAEALVRIFRCPVELICNDTSLLCPADDHGASAESGLWLARFPLEVLQKIRQTVVMDEIGESDPELHNLMKLHKVEAIVPFKFYEKGSMSWAFFGEHFGEEVYTPLDFKHLEALFERIEECLFENVVPLRSQLEEATRKLNEFKQRLAVTWGELEAVRRGVGLAKVENRRFQEGVAQRRPEDEFQVQKPRLPEAIASGEKTMEQYLTEREGAIVAVALRKCADDKIETARLLGISQRLLQHLIDRHALDSG